MAITAGTYTIGSGGDYATYTAFVADIGTQTGDLTGQLISDSTVSTNTFFSHDQGGYVLTINADNDHGGVLANAHTLSIAHNNNGINPAQSLMTNEFEIYVYGFHIERTVAGSATTKSLIAPQNYSTGKMYIHHMFIEGGSLTGNGIYLSPKSSDQTEVWSCLIWDFTSSGGIRNLGTGLSNYWTVENCTIRNCLQGILIGTGGGQFLNNNALFSNSVYDLRLSSAGSTTGDNNASTDATADDCNTQNNNNINLTETDQVESTSSASSDFMKPKETGLLFGNGKAPTISGNTSDLAGVPYDGNYPIGCYTEEAIISLPSGSMNLLGVGV